MFILWLSNTFLVFLSLQLKLGIVKPAVSQKRDPSQRKKFIRAGGQG
jgi:hypothetical protein